MRTLCLAVACLIAAGCATKHLTVHPVDGTAHPIQATGTCGG